jgi:mono/diheme cytochrome c family protein
MNTQHIVRVLVGTVAVVGILAVGCAGKQTPPDRISSPGEALFNGQTKSEVNWYKCHSGDGSGTWRGPDLAKRVPKLTDQQIVKTIMDGPGFMPSFKDKVSRPEALAIAGWLHQRFPPQ